MGNQFRGGARPSTTGPRPSRTGRAGFGTKYGTDYVAISRDYMAAKNAFDYSTQRMVRMVLAKDKSNLGPRRPVGSPADFQIPKPPPGARPAGDFPDVSAWFEETAMQLHINAFVRYIEAHRAYYGGRFAEITGAIRKTYQLAIASQRLGLDGADMDLQAFAAALIDERCDRALRSYQRAQSPRSLLMLILTIQEAQQMGAVDGPACKAAELELQKLYDAGKLS